MEEKIAEEVVERLRAHRIFAAVNRRVGVYNVGLRVVLTDGREALWDNDGASGLEAMVLRDGMLVGFVPQIPDSDDLDAAAIAEIIANTNYDAPPPPSKPANPTSAPSGPPPPATPPPKPKPKRSLFRRHR
ncbi:MAG TPA: hypothetical protein VHA79_08950 [Mycobacteriales bacterium]|jgi:hypothetical protein|nr:hypothetical protein [Mycobacteriales bacterium]HVX69803.1 hypothetical protein [Mycobacteriales bacterium]